MLHLHPCVPRDAVRYCAVVYDHGQGSGGVSSTRRFPHLPVPDAAAVSRAPAMAHCTCARSLASRPVVRAGAGALTSLTTACMLIDRCRWRKGAAWRRRTTSPPPCTTCFASSTPRPPSSSCSPQRGRSRAARSASRPTDDVPGDRGDERA